jgi:hypothetical protein
MNFTTWIESSLNYLKQSTVNAFPNTTKRQHVVNEIQITQINPTPYIGVNTLYIKAEALNTNENTKYHPVILFKGLKYHNTKEEENLVNLIINNKNYFFEKLSLENSDVLLRCNCNDFFFRFHHYDHEDKSLYGPNRKQYYGKGLWEANPTKSPGMCKHLMALIDELKNNNFF